MVNAHIIAIGDEILIGQIIDTNSSFIAKALTDIGVYVTRISAIADSENEIIAALEAATLSAKLVLITGGLGPTKDDITKHTFCNFFNDSLVEDSDTLQHIQHIFDTLLKREMLPQNASQALVPSKAEILKNKYGTAPGLWMENSGTTFIAMPGVPFEMKGLMQNEIIPKIQERYDLPYIVHKTLLTYGAGESVIAQRIYNWENKLPKDIKLAYLPALGKVRLRLSTSGFKKENVTAYLDKYIESLIPLLGESYVGFESDGSIEVVVAKLLQEKGATLSIAESCTGGAIAQAITKHAGVSSFFKGGVVSYATQSKVDVLGLPASLVKNDTVVSQKVVEEMVINVQRKFSTDYAIATTGNAGPTQGDLSQPVGTVFIAIATPDTVNAYKFSMGTNRARVIGKSVNKAFELLREELLKI